MEKVDLTAFYPHPPARVWKALTEAPALSRWLMPSNFEPALGATFRFEEAGRHGVRSIRCEIVDLEPERKLSYTWADEGEDEPPSVVAWTLQPTDDGGTRVRLQHQVMAAEAPYVSIELGLNWCHAMHVSLPEVLELIRAQSRRPVPIVYDEDEIPSTRLAGFRNREEATCG